MLRSIATGLLVTALSILVSQGELFRTFELKTLDTRFRLRGSRPSPVSIVFIGDDSIEAFGRWPWSWDYHALLVDVLSRAGAKVVLFDILFSENPGKRQARFLADMSRSAGNIYFCSVFDKLSATGKGGTAPLLAGEDLLEPIPELLRVGAGTGHCNAVPDIDGTTRRVPLLVRYRGGLFPSAPLLIAADAMGATLDETSLADDGWIELHLPGEPSVRIPVDDEGQTMINFNGGMEAFSAHSFRQVIEADQFPDEAALDLSVFKDRIVLVGTTFAGNTDLRPTPFSSAFPMFLTQAALIDSLLQGEFVRRPPSSVSFALLLLVGALIGGLTYLLKPLVSLGVSVITGVGYLGIAPLRLLPLELAPRSRGTPLHRPLGLHRRHFHQVLRRGEEGEECAENVLQLRYRAGGQCHDRRPEPRPPGRRTERGDGSFFRHPGVHDFLRGQPGRGCGSDAQRVPR